MGKSSRLHAPRPGILAATILLAFSPTMMPGSSFTAEGIEIQQRARSLQPGEVVLLTVESEEPLRNVQATAFGKTFPFFAEPEGRRWKGLIGIDLAVKAGAHELQIEGEAESGPIRVGRTLQVLPKKFPTRRLTVDEKYVNPPKESLARIKRESAQISAIFKARSMNRLWSGPFESPVPGAPNSGFGKRSILNGKPRSPHTGADFDADAGTPVKSPNSGRVVLVENLYYSGNTVILDHGMGLYSYFAHLSQFNCKVGDQIKKGDVLGLVGATGRVTGPHLHWTVRLDETRVDPLSLIAALVEE